MPEQPQPTLRVEAHQIPALRAAFLDATQMLTNALDALSSEARFPAPWLGDPVSENIKSVYDGMALNDPRSTFHHLVAYRDELVRIYDSLGAMEAEYQRHEADAAALLTPRT